jgi:hypothetical protein
LGQSIGSGSLNEGDTSWIQVQPDNVQTWLQEHGGRLKDAIRILRQMTTA